MVSTSFLSVSVVAIIFALLSILSSVNSSSPSNYGGPQPRGGYTFQRGNIDSNTTVEFFVDLFDPHWKNSWPLFNDVYELYKEKVHFEYIVDPWMVAQAAQVVSVFGTEKEAMFKFLDTAFSKQSADLTRKLSHGDLVNLIAGWATQNTGLTSARYFEGMDVTTAIGRQCLEKTKNTYKSSIITLELAVLGGSYDRFRVNGEFVGGLRSMADWKATLDPLLSVILPSDEESKACKLV